MTTDDNGRDRVEVIVLGGTITMVPQASGGIVPTLTGDDLIAACPGLDEVADLAVSTPFLIPGSSLGPDHIAKVAGLASDAVARGAAGVVVAQGTDTIDEVAFLLDLWWPHDAPIVVTGAMRGASAPGADGPANLLAAVTVAAATAARGLGALVVLNDEVHLARTVVKSDTAAPDTFRSPGLGPLGRVLEGRFRPRWQPLTRPGPMLDTAAVAEVAIAKTWLGDDGRMLAALAGMGYKGCVIEAMGAGHVPMALVPALEALLTDMPVVLATRVPAGPVFRDTYGFAGSERDLLARGVIPAGSLPSFKARLLLSCLCGQGADRPRIAAAFDAYA